MSASGARRAIRVILHSGLGNQMFQYAAAKALAVERGCELLIDPVTGFQHDPYGRRYELGAFQLRSACLPEACPEGRSLRVRAALRALRELETSAIRWWGRYYIPGLRTFSLRCAGVAFGYWQSPRYFEGMEAFLREEFRLRQAPAAALRQWAERLQSSESVALHIRLRHADSASGEVVSPRLAEPGRQEALLQYYRAAIACLKNKVRDPFWFVVSDSDRFDPGAVGLPRETPVVCGDSSRPPAEDLWLLSQAKHKIIGPSTFGWWGAWLSGPGGGTVCVPRVFRPGGSRRPAVDAYPAHWIKLEDSASPQQVGCIP